MVPLEAMIWLGWISIFSWVNNHPVFDKTGNEKQIDYDTVVKVLFWVSVVFYVISLVVRG